MKTAAETLSDVFNSSKYSEADYITEAVAIDAMEEYAAQSKWISVDLALPEHEDYYDVRYDNGEEDEKPFRIRPSKNIRGFMTEITVTHWRPQS